MRARGENTDAQICRTVGSNSSGVLTGTDSKIPAKEWVLPSSMVAEERTIRPSEGGSQRRDFSTISVIGSRIRAGIRRERML